MIGNIEAILVSESCSIKAVMTETSGIAFYKTRNNDRMKLSHLHSCLASVCAPYWKWKKNKEMATINAFRVMWTLKPAGLDDENSSNFWLMVSQEQRLFQSLRTRIALLERQNQPFSM